MNWAWLRALGVSYTAPYEIAAHPLGRKSRPVLSEDYYAKRRKRIRIRPWTRSLRLGSARFEDDLEPRPSMSRPDGSGLLILESDLLGPIGEHEDTRPFTPVVLIDGEPVATGFGRGLITLEPGDHLVQIQSGASAGSWPVQVRANGYVWLSSFVPQRLGPARSGAEFLRQFPIAPTQAIPRRLSHLVDAPFAMTAAFAGVFFGTSAVSSLDPPKWIEVAAAMAFGLLSPLIALGLIRLVHRAAVAWAEHRLARPLPPTIHAPQRFPAGSWRLIDPQDPTAPQGSEGMAVLRLTLTFEQKAHRQDLLIPETPPIDMTARIGEEYPRRLRPSLFGPKLAVDLEREARRAAKRRKQFGEAYPPEARPWIDAPLVTVDNESVPAAWGINEYRLPPGLHRIKAAVPPPPEVLTGEATEIALAEANAEYRADLSTDRPIHLNGMARIEMAPAETGWELSRYSALLTLEP